MPPAWIRENILLAPLTTLRIGGPARYLAEATCESQVQDGLAFAEGRGVPVFVLGGGSNILVADSGFPGLVLRVALMGVSRANSRNDGVVTAGAGEEWDGFVRLCVEREWAGVECLSGIPGSIGGTPVQNVGAYGQEVSEVIVTVRVLDRVAKSVRELQKTECGFTYRTSIFNTTHRDRYIVLGVTFALQVGGAARIDYADVRRHFAGRTDHLSLTEVREAVRRIRASKAMLLVPEDPDCRSAGSFFKNPIVSEERFLEIESEARRHGCLQEGESLPRFMAPAGMVKIPAAWLIERAGFQKGYTRRKAGISTKHTLALVNRGGATASDILELMREIQDRVNQIYGVWLNPEPVFVGFDEPMK